MDDLIVGWGEEESGEFWMDDEPFGGDDSLDGSREMRLDAESE